MFVSQTYNIIPDKRTYQEKAMIYDQEPITVMTSYFKSIFKNYFGTQTPVKQKYNGLMPHSPTRKTDAYITPQTVMAPIAMTGCTHDDDDCWDYLSKSDSSTSSSGSSFSSISGHNSSRQRRSVSSLSEILCEHYVQKTLNSNDEMGNKDVPLETYKVFEASRKTVSLESSTEEDDDESWFIWDNLQKTKEWIQVVDEELFLPKEKVTTEITIATTVVEKARSIRANPAHLRMIVAEVNMMRANKIVGPLKSRGFLTARTDKFVSNQASPLGLPI
ncbi:uncharacterized protein EV154DRAFT_605016 [Mucor mucedo]|uniref:uncharacterized protein n=1 Tax=Mucor mucedo TaxID=29922 RepID=UPI00221F0BFF|nr:uncharacterized protein EV154DRAFT_605016 [Mucor mucedo]KAI7888146.1 hypothetical protein EV154DRAFT_605016 [Mucor mucedo]